MHEDLIKPYYSNYDEDFKNLIRRIKQNLEDSNTLYNVSRWNAFVEALFGIIKAFDEIKKYEYQEKLKQVQETPEKNRINKAHNKKIKANVDKVQKFIKFIKEHETDLLSDDDYLLGLACIKKTEYPEEEVPKFLNDLYENLRILGLILGSKRTNAFKTTIPKPQKRTPYKTQILREALILCLLSLSERYLGIKPKKSSDLKGFNAIATPILVYLAEASGDYGSHNYHEMYAHIIDPYKDMSAYYKCCFKQAHKDGYTAFREFYG